MGEVAAARGIDSGGSPGPTDDPVAQNKDLEITTRLGADDEAETETPTAGSASFDHSEDDDSVFEIDIDFEDEDDEDGEEKSEEQTGAALSVSEEAQADTGVTESSGTDVFEAEVTEDELGLGDAEVESLDTAPDFDTDTDTDADTDTETQTDPGLELETAPAPQDLESNLEAIIEQTATSHPRARLLIAGMRAAPNLGSEYRDAFDGIYPALAKRHEAKLIPFLLEDVAARQNLNQADGIHPTAEGHELIAERVWQELEPILKANP